MVDMDRRQPKTELARSHAQHVQQHHGIDAAGQSDGEALAAQIRRGKHRSADAGKPQASVRRLP
jgi:hypothetical protein